uniref:Fatty acid hydroxylase domain-containing protein n=1 Tax=Kalanchoe fedtschenkoi TaxID=63787 RepID=A0A7N0T403_KALFE
MVAQGFTVDLNKPLVFQSIIISLSNAIHYASTVWGRFTGLCVYDVTHYYLHHEQPSREVTKNLKKYHLNHHFRIQNKGFSITSSLWDKVFGTLPQTRSAAKSR